MAKTIDATKIGGWLLFLCIVLTIVSPLRILFETVQDLQAGRALEPVNLIQIGLSITAGLMLWTRQSAGPLVAKIYFGILFVLFSGIIGMVAYNNPTLTPEQSQLLTSFVSQAVWCPIWIAYLQFSKRVRLTFTRDVPAQFALRELIEPAL
jgi:hypothetical protein